MALTKISRGLLDTGISDSSDATAITIDSSENVTIGTVAAGASTATPVELNLGSTFSDAAGSKSKMKLKVFEDTSSNILGLGVSAGTLELHSNQTFTFLVNESEKMRLASDGDFFLNTTSAMDNCFASFQDGNNGEAMVGISAKNDNNVGIRFGVGTTRKWVNYRDTSDNLIWYSNAAGAERVRFYSGGGITFNGDNAAANALNDYEEGTWTPVLNDSGAGITNTGGTSYNWYVKVGKVVHLSANIVFSAADNSGNPIRITGLPFTNDSKTAVAGSMISRYAGTVGTIAPYITGSALYFYLQSSSSSWRAIAYNDVGAYEMHMSITYMTT